MGREEIVHQYFNTSNHCIIIYYTNTSDMTSKIMLFMKFSLWPEGYTSEIKRSYTV